MSQVRGDELEDDMSDPEHDPDADRDFPDDEDLFAAVRAVRAEANAATKTALEEYHAARLRINAHVQEVTEPLIAAFLEEFSPIVAMQTEVLATAYRDYRSTVERLQADADKAGRELRLRHQARMDKLHADEPRCPMCFSYRVIEGECQHCNGEPPAEKKAPPVRKRVTA